MSPVQAVVYTRDGQRGVIAEPGGTQAMLRLDNGQQVLAPTELLRPQEDGSYLLDADLAQLTGSGPAAEAGDRLVVPVMAEELAVGKRPVDSGGVRVSKQVHSETRTVDEPGFREEIEVERIPRNQVLDQPAQVRQEDETLIIPLMEEVLVVEKRLVLREEVRITRRRSEVRSPQQVTLRREEATIERLAADQPPSVEDGPSLE